MTIYEPVISYRKKEIEAVELIDAASAYKHIKDFLWSIRDFNPNKEYAVLVGMNTRGIVKFTRILSIGTDNQCLVTPREVIKEILLSNCNSFILAHSHPTGDPGPSSADSQITRKIREAAGIMDIQFRDHIIIGLPENDPAGLGYYSYREAGLI
jgi:DNA repair protein RadC